MDVWMKLMDVMIKEKMKAACRCSIPACSRDGRTDRKEGANQVRPHLASQHLCEARRVIAMHQQHI